MIIKKNPAVQIYCCLNTDINTHTNTYNNEKNVSIQLPLDLVCRPFSAAKLPLVQIYCVRVKYIKNVQMCSCSYQYFFSGLMSWFNVFIF